MAATSGWAVGDEEERELEQADRKGRAFDPAIRAGPHDGKQRDRGNGKTEGAGNAV
jgi:hypothetical protein